jgi:glutathione S-transferase
MQFPLHCDTVSGRQGEASMAETVLIISSRNYSSWSLRGWLLARMSGLDFTVKGVEEAGAAAARQELLMRTSSILVPCLVHDGVQVWDTLAIAEYLNELAPDAGMFPADRTARARCRSISGEMHSGFSALRSSLPMNLRSRRTGFKLWSAAKADVDRITTIWHDCLAQWGGPWLFGARYSVADAMYAPVATRFVTYDVALDAVCAAYRDRAVAHADMRAWHEDAMAEHEEMPELDVEF